MNINEFVARLEGVHKRGDRYSARCPGHSDRTPSLSITEGDDGRVLVKCFGGCPTEDVVAKMGLKMRDLMPDTVSSVQRPRGVAPRADAPIAAKPNGQNWRELASAVNALQPPGHRVAAVYHYPKEGMDYAAVARFESSDGKTFRQFHCEGGMWYAKAPTALWPLYGIEEVNEPVLYVCEGEKATGAGWGIGLPATCSSGGAGGAKKSEWSPCKDRHIVVLPDADEPGMNYADDVVHLAFEAGAATVKVVILPGLGEGGDLYDWVAAREGADPEALRAEIQALVDATPEVEKPASVGTTNLPIVLLPGGDRTINQTASELGKAIAGTKRFFMRGGVVSVLQVDPDDGPSLEARRPASLASDFETVATLGRAGKGGKVAPDCCREAEAKLISSSQAFTVELPAVKIVSPVPVLVERNGELVEITGHDPESQVYAGGVPTTDIDIEQAKALIMRVIADFKFASAADQSRALAALLTPALVFGNLLGGRAPVDLGEADSSQTGKGFRAKLTAAIYGQRVKSVTQKSGGVGSLEETFNAALMRGKNFIALDNVRGKIDSPAIESFMTEDSYSARCAYCPNTEIDPRRIVLLATSNKAEMTTDFANRCACVRLRKQPAEYQFASFPEGDVLDHIRANQPMYLSAVHAVVRAWHQAGKPRTKEYRHDFRAWAQRLDWIIQNIFGAAPLLDGHRETQIRMTTPALNWLRDLALEVQRAGGTGQSYRASDLADLLFDTEVELPGMDPGGDLTDELTRKAVLQAMGRRLGKCFQTGDLVVIDGMRITRVETEDPILRKTQRTYIFE